MESVGLISNANSMVEGSTKKRIVNYSSNDNNNNSNKNKEMKEETIFSPSKPSRWGFVGVKQQLERTERIFNRDFEFHQSQGKPTIRKRIGRVEWRFLYGTDWFHSLVDSPFHKILFVLMGTYLLIIVIFALLYRWISVLYKCDFSFDSYVKAFTFSLETMATIGYSSAGDDMYFGDCLLAIGTLTLQMCVKLIYEALTVGILYCKISRPQARASTIIFSNKAVIRRIRGKLYFMFQLCELRKQQLVEAHIRVYLVRNEPDYEEIYKKSKEFDPESAANISLPKHKFIQTCSMRLSHPNDELGGMLLLMLPQLIVHEIDAFSPLMPPTSWFCSSNGKMISWLPPTHAALNQPSTQMKKLPIAARGTLPNKAAPYTTANNTTNNNHNKKSNHINFTGVVEKEELPRLMQAQSSISNAKVIKDNTISFDSPLSTNRNIYNLADDLLSPVDHLRFATPRGVSETGRPLSVPRLNDNNYRISESEFDVESSTQLDEKLMIQSFMRDRQIEIIAIVEGIDSSTGGNVQARHSFTVDEIEWDKGFLPCVYKDNDDGYTTVDFSLFHELVDVSKNASGAGSVASFL
eukprot:gene10781-14476_t